MIRAFLSKGAVRPAASHLNGEVAGLANWAGAGELHRAAVFAFVAAARVETCWLTPTICLSLPRAIAGRLAYLARLNTASVLPPAVDAALTNFSSSNVKLLTKAPIIASLLVWIERTLDVQDNGLVSLNDGPCAKVCESPIPRRFDFLWCAL